MLLWPKPGGLPARLVLLLEGELPSNKAGTWCDKPCGCVLVPCWEAAMEASVLLMVLLTLLCWLLSESDGWAPAAPEFMALQRPAGPCCGWARVLLVLVLLGLACCAGFDAHKKRV